MVDMYVKMSSWVCICTYDRLWQIATVVRVSLVVTTNSAATKLEAIITNVESDKRKQTTNNYLIRYAPAYVSRTQVVVNLRKT